MSNGNTHIQVDSIKQLCRDSAPLIYLFQYKENYKQRLIRKLLTEDLRLVLKGKRQRDRRSKPHTRVPKSGESTAQIPSYHSDMSTDSTDKILGITQGMPMG